MEQSPQFLIVKHLKNIRNGARNILETGALAKKNKIVIPLHEVGHALQKTREQSFEFGLALVAVEGAKELARADDELENVLQRLHEAEQIVALRFRRHFRFDQIFQHGQQLLVGQGGAEVFLDVHIHHRLFAIESIKNPFKLMQ